MLFFIFAQAFAYRFHLLFISFGVGWGSLCCTQGRIKIPKIKHQLTSGQPEIRAQFSLASKDSVHHPHRPLGVAPAFILSTPSGACNPQASATHTYEVILPGGKGQRLPRTPLHGQPSPELRYLHEFTHERETQSPSSLLPPALEGRGVSGAMGWALG